MELPELSNEQRRQLIDATQVFEGWREASRAFRHSYRGSMRWRKINSAEYLYRFEGGVQKSLGRRSPETEHIKDEYVAQRTRLRERRKRLDNRLKEMERINRAYRLGRMPKTAAAVLRKLDEAGLLGKQLIVVGTHSLFAYEAKSGVTFDNGITATTDIDLLIDSRQRLSLAIAQDVKPEGILGLLRRADKSFERTSSYRAQNDEGYYVDLIAPIRRDEATSPNIQLGNNSDDLVAASIIGLQWLMNAPRFEAVVVADDGRPLWMSCIDPRAFALHKWWMSKRPDREAQKRRRDAEQARAVYSVATDFLNLPFNAKSLSALPLELTQSVKELVSAPKKTSPGTKRK